MMVGVLGALAVAACDTIDAMKTGEKGTLKLPRGQEAAAQVLLDLPGASPSPQVSDEGGGQDGAGIGSAPASVESRPQDAGVIFGAAGVFVDCGKEKIESTVSEGSVQEEAARAALQDETADTKVIEQSCRSRWSDSPSESGSLELVASAAEDVADDAVQELRQNAAPAAHQEPLRSAEYVGGEQLVKPKRERASHQCAA